MTGPWTAQAVADLVGGRLSGPGDVVLRRVRSLALAEADELSVCGSARYAAALATSRAGAVIIGEALALETGPATRIIVADPSRAVFAASVALHPSVHPGSHIAPTVRIGRGATIGDGCSIGEYVVIGENARIGARTMIAPHVVIAPEVVVGDDVRLDAHVTLYEGARLGNRVWCKASASIGGTGFGYRSGPDGHVRVPHIGLCILEDDVDVGANSCIDRGSLDDTRIGRGTKIDNLVHIAHNVHIGAGCLIMACVGVAGSAHIGDRVILAGQSGVIDHVEIGDDARIGAKTAVMSDVPAGAAFSGIPGRPHRDFLRASATMYRLTPYVKTLEALAKERDGE